MDDKTEKAPEAEGLLRELYTLAAQYEESDMARELLLAKAGKTVPAAEPAADELRRPAATQMEYFSQCMAELAAGGYAETTTKDAGEPRCLSLLRDSAEKEYIRALAALRSGRTESHRLEAMNRIRTALSQKPNDPRLITLALVLQQA